MLIAASSTISATMQQASATRPDNVGQAELALLCARSTGRPAGRTLSKGLWRLQAGCMWHHKCIEPGRQTGGRVAAAGGGPWQCTTGSSAGSAAAAGQRALRRFDMPYSAASIVSSNSFCMASAPFKRKAAELLMAGPKPPPSLHAQVGSQPNWFAAQEVSQQQQGALGARTLTRRWPREAGPAASRAAGCL
jgi:hypothetical protein